MVLGHAFATGPIMSSRTAHGLPLALSREAAAGIARIRKLGAWIYGS